MAVQPEPTYEGRGPEDDDRLVQNDSASRAARWERILIWFMRGVALLWIAKGLGAWAQILGAGHSVVDFEVRSPGDQAAIIYFAVIDLLAAVGLWLASVWGGVLWLLAVTSHMIIAFFFPSYVPGNYLTLALFGGLILAYLALSWLAADESNE